MGTFKKPNVLLILTDQQRFDSLGCYGAPGVYTPNLDRLAEEGVLFRNCYVTNSICTPSRASIWTGKHPPGHGVYALHDRFPEDEILMSYRLQQAGYDTALFGKLHISGRAFEARHRHQNDGFRIYEWCLNPANNLDSSLNGYAEWLKSFHPDFFDKLKEKGRFIGHTPIEKHLSYWAAQRTIDFITRERDQKKPFFCCLSLFDPHDPYWNYPREMEALIDKTKLAPIIRDEKPMSERPYAHQLEHDHCYLGPVASFSSEQIRKWRYGYQAAVSMLDRQTGRVLDAIKRNGLGDNTIIIFTSDHGDMLGDHGLLAKGCFFYDPCVRVPLIIRAPGYMAAGITVETLCQPHDITSTILLAAGFTRKETALWMPDSCDLRSPDLLEARGYAACMYRNSGISDERRPFSPPLLGTMWREGKFKLNVYHNTAPLDNRNEGELYDMEKDLLEMNNLWNNSAYTAVKDQLLNHLADWLVVQDFQGRGRGKDVTPESFEERNLGKLA